MQRSEHPNFVSPPVSLAHAASFVFAADLRSALFRAAERRLMHRVDLPKLFGPFEGMLRVPTPLRCGGCALPAPVVCASSVPVDVLLTGRLVLHVLAQPLVLDGHCQLRSLVFVEKHRRQQVEVRVAPPVPKCPVDVVQVPHSVQEGGRASKRRVEHKRKPVPSPVLWHPVQVLQGLELVVSQDVLHGLVKVHAHESTVDHGGEVRCFHVSERQVLEYVKIHWLNDGGVRIQLEDVAISKKRAVQGPAIDVGSDHVQVLGVPVEHFVARLVEPRLVARIYQCVAYKMYPRSRPRSHRVQGRLLEILVQHDDRIVEAIVEVDVQGLQATLELGAAFLGIARPQNHKDTQARSRD